MRDTDAGAQRNVLPIPSLRTRSTMNCSDTRCETREPSFVSMRFSIKSSGAVPPEQVKRLRSMVKSWSLMSTRGNSSRSAEMFSQ